jgi:GTP-binding protein EngB required for normal cell division
MAIPSDNINICFVGGISTGKSTGLNSVFGKKLTQCHFKRTTMVPTVYIENSTDLSNSDEIYEKISQKNAEIIEKQENGQSDDYAELVFNVGKLDINIIEKSFVNVYDIPGLNDPKTKQIYYDYLESNFYKFNIIVFFVDIRSGLNTSDENDILNFITQNTKLQMDHNNRQIFTLVVVNKADDMQLNVGTDEVMVTGEFKEMFEQVQHTVSEEFRRKSIDNQLIGIIPLCAIDAYLYRMVQKFGTDFKLTPEQILKIGVNENGKKFSTFKPAEQERKVYNILRDETFIETMIKLSGFSQFEKILKDFLVNANVGKKIRIDNILYELRGIPNITRETYHQNNITTVYSLVVQYMNVYNKIKAIDEEMFETKIQEFVEKNLTLFESNLLNITAIHDLITYYDDFISEVMGPFFRQYYDVTQYSGFMKTCVKTLLMTAFEKSVTDNEIIQNFTILQKVGLFTHSNIDDLFNVLCANPRLQNTIKAFENHKDTELITLLQKCRSESCTNDMTRVLRFLIINKLALEDVPSRMYIRYLIYNKYGEVSIADYIHSIMQRPTIEMIINGISDSDLRDPVYMLDMFYLNRF